MKRYSLEEKQAYEGESMWPDKDGDFCLYDDAKELETENNRLREALEGILQISIPHMAVPNVKQAKEIMINTAKNIAKQALEVKK